MIMIALAVGIPVGCDKSETASVSTIPATAPATGPTKFSSTVPSTTQTAATTELAIPDPREAKYLTDITQLTWGSETAGDVQFNWPSAFDRAGEGYFSADMKWIIFQATPKAEVQYQMYVARLTLGEGAVPKINGPNRISPLNSRNTCGFFSPDGKTVIFASTAGKEKPDEPNAGYQRQGGNYRWAFPDGMEIYSANRWAELVEERRRRLDPNAKDGGLRPDTLPTHPEIVNLASESDRLTNNDAYDAEGSFSPDGKWIVFTSRRTGDTEIWVMKADGSNPVQMTHSPGYDGGPFFAPDGKRLLYRSDRKKNDLLQIFTSDLTFDPAGNITGMTNEKQLTNDANVNWGPYFHPDNKHIIYATSRHGHHNYELYLMRDDGTHNVRITYCPGFDGLPAFSPDGKYLMWSSKRTKDNTTQLFIAKYHAPDDEADQVKPTSQP